jgi:hypothetical protein
MNLSFASIEYRPLARHPPSVAEAEDSAEALLSGRDTDLADRPRSHRRSCCVIGQFVGVPSAVAPDAR